MSIKTISNKEAEEKICPFMTKEVTVLHSEEIEDAIMCKTTSCMSWVVKDTYEKRSFEKVAAALNREQSKAYNSKYSTPLTDDDIINIAKGLGWEYDNTDCCFSIFIEKAGYCSLLVDRQCQCIKESNHE